MPTAPSLDLTYEAWYDEYHSRISEWITDCAIGRPAHLILALPQLIQTLLELGQSEPISDSLREESHAKAISAMDGMDYLPRTNIATTTFAQDSMSLARFLSAHLEEIPAEVQEAVWHGDDTLAQTLAWMLKHDGQPSKKGC